MAHALSRRRRHDDAPYWPGFVDAMAQLLLVITFLLSVFIVAQFLLAREISGQDSALRQSRSQIIDLGKRLNSALAQRVQELTRYRSEFFGRLRKILSQRSDILVVGDRFVFQSEVLFPKGSAEIQPAGLVEMDKLATALKELEGEIPADIAWVLRVDGHTDTDPIQTLFKSNWEL